MHKYTSVIFDLDGTLLDTLDDLANALNLTLEHFGFPVHSKEEIRKMIGNGMRKLIKDASPVNTSEKTLSDMLLFFKTYYNRHCADKTAPYENIIHLLKTLRKAGVKTAVVSNKSDASVKILCEKYFCGLLDAALGENEDAGIKKKPSPDLVFLAEKMLSADENTVYVGDSEVDILTAKNSNLDCISVCWGFRDRKTLEKYGASVIAETPDELLKLL